MPTYKTPDVYIEEISLLPPSVAEVETAVPAFIGYTEKAMEFGPNDLHMQPTRIKSLLEYNELFGYAPSVKVNSVTLDENNNLASHDIASNFYMYDALQLFFKNGGGKCYIISVGLYKTKMGSIIAKDFTDGLDALQKKDEPTLILFPDAVLLENSTLYSIQQHALKQCAQLQDRFCVFDMFETKKEDPTFGWRKGYEEFRNQVGINHLKYGSAYTPWLKTSLGIDLHYRDLMGKVKRGGADLKFENLTKDPAVIALVGDLDNAVADAILINTAVNGWKDPLDSLRAKYLKLQDGFKTTPTVSTFRALFTFLYDIATFIDGLLAANSGAKNDKLRTDIGTLITTVLHPAYTSLIGYDKAGVAALTGFTEMFSTRDLAALQWDGLFDDKSPDALSEYGSAATDAEQMKTAEPFIAKVFDQVNAGISFLVASASGYEATREDALYKGHPIFKNLIDKLEISLTMVPPSGAVVGVYASVDGSRGVWKAPANVSLAGVVGVTQPIDNTDQDELNVDTVAGKSINAIRVFTGKGTLIWGARTLAGNDNEWRYVSVRRFFNMVEESIKKSTYWAVFEANDANTWIKVKGMIENYLTLKWRDGALMGAKPGDAFFVKIGLGITMTPMDILEGRMNVEIGMCVVRPAEFIILKFSHKMPVA